uniref:C2H2-type domain-containing protein n=1 Tax=Schizophyllum commune (strain H4-8 / FGSC 9210) TaxID=578458 RepID=D8QI01_SCHCM
MISQDDDVSNASTSGMPPTMFPPEPLSAQSQSFATGGTFLVSFGFEAILPSVLNDPCMPPRPSDVLLSTTDNDFQTLLAPEMAHPYSAPDDSRNMHAPDTSQETPHNDRPGGLSMISRTSAKPQGDDHLFRSDRFLRAVGTEAQVEASLRRRRPGRGPDPAHRRCVRCGRSFTRNKNFRGESQPAGLSFAQIAIDLLLRHENRREYACTTHGCLKRFNTESDRDSHIQNIHMKTQQGERKRLL